MIFVWVAFAVLLLAVFYFATKTEGVRKDLASCQAKLNSMSSDNRNQTEVLVLLADDLQKQLVSKLAMVKQTRGELTEVKVADAIISASSYIIQDMVYKNHTVKQAIERNLGRNSDLTAEQVHNFFVDQPHAIKQAWTGTHVRQYMDLTALLLESVNS